jgi:GNAT superfamily N-acetyltransferase
VSETIEIRRLEPHDISLIGEIDRSEHVALAYKVEGGRLLSRSVDWDVPTWNPDGAGEHSVAGMIEHWRPPVDRGAFLLGAFDGDDLLGLAIVDGSFEPGLAWLAFLHVSRHHRREGVGLALWAATVQIALTAGAESIYVSAVPSDSAVGFYLNQGCVQADPPHPDLFAKEPEDIHFICPIG